MKGPKRWKVHNKGSVPRTIWYIDGSYFLSQMEKLISNPVFLTKFKKYTKKLHALPSRRNYLATKLPDDEFTTTKLPRTHNSGALLVTPTTSRICRDRLFWTQLIDEFHNFPWHKSHSNHIYTQRLALVTFLTTSLISTQFNVVTFSFVIISVTT